MVWRILALALAAGCYGPKIASCSIKCGQANGCPSGLACASDGFCHAAATELCTAPPMPDGGRAGAAGSGAGPDTWQPLATLGAPSPRSDSSMVWTGHEVIVWGGHGGQPLRDGARYDRVGDN